MQYQIPPGNPFGVLTSIVAPAILTNASSVLALGTSNRLARVVDRTRIVYEDLASTELGSAEHDEWLHQLSALRERGQMLLTALRLFYAALGLFAATALVSVGGSISAYYSQRVFFELTGALAMLTGVCAVVGLAVGCFLMVHETRLAMRSLAEEAKIRMQPVMHAKSQ